MNTNGRGLRIGLGSEIGVSCYVFMGSFISAPVWAQGLVDVLGVKSSSPLSQGLDVREAEEQLDTEVRFGLMAGLTDESLTGGDSPSAR